MMEYFLLISILFIILTFLFFKIDLLIWLYFILSFLPFSISIIYIIDKDYDWAGTDMPQMLYGMNDIFRQAQYETDVMQILFLIGLLSVWSLFFGYVLCEKINLNFRKKVTTKKNLFIKNFSKLNFFGMSVWLSIALYLCSLSARNYSIFDYSYGSVTDIPISGGSYLIGYSMFLTSIIYCFSQKIKFLSWRYLMIFSFLSYEIIFHQLLVGSRECVGLITAIYILFKNKNFKSGIYISKIDVCFIFIVISLLALGAFRNAIYLNPDGIFERDLLSLFKNNPWNSTLLSILGFADIYMYDKSIIYFSHYSDFIIKFFPSFILESIFKLNVTNLSEPTIWYNKYTTGGVYYPLVVFKSFGFLLGFFFLTLLFYCLTIISKFSNSTHPYKQLFYAMMIVTSFRIMWYGDVDLIRGIQAWFIVCLLDQGINIFKRNFLTTKRSINTSYK